MITWDESDRSSCGLGAERRPHCRIGLISRRLTEGDRRYDEIAVQTSGPFVIYSPPAWAVEGFQRGKKSNESALRSGDSSVPVTPALMNPAVKKEKGKASLPANQWSVDEVLRRCSRQPTDDVAWGEFVRRFNAVIRANVRRTFHRKARVESDRKPQFRDDVVDDLVQSVYFRLVEERCRALKRFQGSHDNSIFHYLAMISVNVVIDYFREIKAKKRPKVSYSIDELRESGGDGFLRREPDWTDNRGDLTLEDIEKALRKAVGRRNRDRDTLIFKLHYVEGLTSDEIINVMGLDIKAVAVNSILSRTLQKVRLALLSGR